jgi:hypothetical protein
MEKLLDKINNAIINNPKINPQEILNLCNDFLKNPDYVEAVENYKNNLENGTESTKYLDDFLLKLATIEYKDCNFEQKRIETTLAVNLYEMNMLVKASNLTSDYKKETLNALNINSDEVALDNSKCENLGDNENELNDFELKAINAAKNILDSFEKQAQQENDISDKKKISQKVR